ncbi:hypothetical protein GIB67_009024 [Kingdonia uniflora]|uniref:BRCT domain-containing protein n=1 Tax=Kingdonia uniflora TaxID=39325 RepID=A0A7J7LW00_9MAGN|nr:hypothetical protein GIB67_009024 [Kingdonia uniflora]
MSNMTEARKQVMAATERLGGQYSPNLHPQCTHLVVQISFRLSESLYTVKTAGENGSKLEFNHLAGVTDTEKSCLPVGLHDHSKQFKTSLQPQPPFSGKVSGASREFPLSGFSIYVDSDISDELQKKVADVATVEGATIVEHWFVGCGATHVVCERLSIQRYIGHSNNVVTPLWILKTAKEKYMQRLVHLSADLARHVGVILENLQNAVQDASEISGLRYAPRSRDRPTYRENRVSSEERQQIVNLAKVGVRNRRGRRMQVNQK